MKLDIICIGTPTVIGDSFGPIVGTMLKAMKGYDNRLDDVNVIGCTDDPVSCSTYDRKVKEIRDGAFVIAVDAAISPSEKHKVGTIVGTASPVRPGAGVDKENMPVGDFSYKLVVCHNKLQFMMYNNIDEVNAAALSTVDAIIDRIEVMLSTDC